MSSKLPVVFMAFANDQDAHLTQLKKESRALYQQLVGLKKADRIALHREESSDLNELYQDMLTYDGQIVVFHYAGHSDGKSLRLEGGKGSSKGIAQLLGQQKRLQLVFLNGCANDAQVDILHEAGVPAVIATRVEINDERACEFASAFYRALVAGRSIFDAFDGAVAFMTNKFGTPGKDNAPAAGWQLEGFELDDENNTEDNSFEWGLHVRADARADVAAWRLPEAKQDWQTPLNDWNGPITNADGTAISIEQQLRIRTLEGNDCLNCGARWSAATGNRHCPVCNTPAEEPAATQTTIPDSLLPAAVDEAGARKALAKSKALKNWDVNKLQLLYVPYWAFSTNTRSTLAGERGVFDPASRELSWETVDEQFDLQLDEVLVRAGDAPVDMGDTIGDWSWALDNRESVNHLPTDKALVPLDKNLQSSFSLMSNWLREEVDSEAKSLVGGHQQKNIKTETHYGDFKAESILLPHWCAQLSDGRTETTALVHGQSGAIRVLPDNLDNNSSERNAIMNRGSQGLGAGTTGPSYKSSIFGGLGIGLMVGLLLGLAAPQAGEDATSIVGIFIGAVGAALAALLGLNDKHFSTAKGLRIGAFGLAVVCAAPAGIYARDHGLFSRSMEQRVGLITEAVPELTKRQAYAAITDSQFAPTAAEQISSIKKAAPQLTEVEVLDFVRAIRIANGPQSKTGLSKTRRVNAESVSPLFNVETDTTACEDLTPRDLEAERTKPADTVLNNLSSTYDEGWLEMMERMANMEPEFQEEELKNVLIVARSAWCKQQSFVDIRELSTADCSLIYASAGRNLRLEADRIPHVNEINTLLSITIADQAKRDNAVNNIGAFICSLQGEQQ